MIDIATAIMRRRIGRLTATNKPLRELIEAKTRSVPVKARPAVTPPPVVDLMAALARSLAQENGQPAAKRTRRGATGDRRQCNLLAPVAGGGRSGREAVRTEIVPKRRHKG